MKEQQLNPESFLLLLIAGVLWGLLFLAFKIFRTLLGFGKIAEAIFDFILCLIAAVGIFICALVIDSGRVRFFQLFLHAVGAVSIIMALGPFVQVISAKIRRMIVKIKNWFLNPVKKIFNRLKQNKSKKKKKKRNKNSHKSKKLKNRTKKRKEKQKRT